MCRLFYIPHDLQVHTLFSLSSMSFWDIQIYGRHLRNMTETLTQRAILTLNQWIISRIYLNKANFDNALNQSLSFLALASPRIRVGWVELFTMFLFLTLPFLPTSETSKQVCAFKITPAAQLELEHQSYLVLKRVDKQGSFHQYRCENDSLRASLGRHHPIQISGYWFASFEFREQLPSQTGHSEWGRMDTRFWYGFQKTPQASCRVLSAL